MFLLEVIKKAIDKDYLISSLKDFNENVLSKIYAKIPINKTVLDKLDESNGVLTFNGNEVGLTEEHTHGNMKTITFSATEPTTVADGEIVMVYEDEE